MFKKYFIFALIIFLAGCATLARENLVALFGTQEPTRFDQPRAIQGAVSYQNEVRPILERRCVVCHSCYDAACQLKLGSYEGITRGGSKAPVYNGARLLEAPLTRLFIDADKPSEWREKGFFPILNEFSDRSTVAEQQASLLARSLDLKARHPLVANKPAPASLDFSLDRTNHCPTIFEYTDYARNNPLMGMPFGFPAITEKEHDTIQRWLQQGAPRDEAALAKSTEQQVQRWEVFFNGTSLRERLVSRYIYEHLFLGDLYFEGEASLQYFRMVRSTTPSGQAIKEIASRRPFEDPGVATFYYRLRPVTESIVAKSHMPYALSEKRMKRWQELFFVPNYSVNHLPTYQPELAANPFKVFEQLPVKSRYQFMLDEVEFSIMGFIKGPVCRGQTALNVINDHFWVFFRNPEFNDNIYGDYLGTSSNLLTLPAEHESNSLVVTPWLHYSHQERKFLEAKSNYLEQRFAKPGSVNLNLVWKGEGNPNAALTIYRHFDNATVLKGLVGEKPKTAWVINYSLLERIHYLLAAGYDVFGNIGHQVNTRLYMNYLRREGEFNFISLLPQASRIGVRDYWYRDVDENIKELVYGKYAHFNRETDIPFTGNDRPEHELMSLLDEHTGLSRSREHDLTAAIADKDLLSDLQSLGRVQGAVLSWMPEASFLRLELPEKPVLNFSLLRNTRHLNLTHLLTEEKTLVPQENSLDVVPGFATAYPNAFYHVKRAELTEFTRQIADLNSEADYIRLVERFGVRRTSPSFWSISDSLMADYRKAQPVDAGILDLNRYENK